MAKKKHKRKKSEKASTTDKVMLVLTAIGTTATVLSWLGIKP